MSQHVTAVYERGVLRPLVPLDLKDQEVVSLSIDRVAENRVAENGRSIADEDQTLFELLDEVGLVGHVKDAPSDLSTNPIHLKGFGKSDD
jgi:predicted DNA-binding antitoxin AbrB/MazE fold protein